MGGQALFRDFFGKYWGNFAGREGNMNSFYHLRWLSFESLGDEAGVVIIADNFCNSRNTILQVRDSSRYAYQFIHLQL